MTLKTLILAGLLSAAAVPALAADVTVTVTGVQPQGGTMLVSLQSRAQFMKPMGAAGAIGEATPGSMTLSIEDVEPGEYAVMVMHDADNNWTMGMKDGKPAEGYGHSGAPAGRTFDEVKIVVPAEGAAVTVPLTYPN